jgi:hypothetical protein
MIKDNPKISKNLVTKWLEFPNVGWNPEEKGNPIVYDLIRYSGNPGPI